MISHHSALWQYLETGALLIDSHGRIQESNPAAARLLNARIGSLTGRTALEATLSYSVLDLLKRAVASTEQLEAEIRWGVPSPRLFRVRAIPLELEPTDPIPACLLLMDDITELRRLETVRRDFVANVSHELRTPLTSIRAMAETLQAGAIHDGEVSERFVSIIVNEVERLTRLLEDLLILSRAESQDVDHQAVEMVTLIRTVIERLQPHAAQSGVSILSNLGEISTVSGAPDQLEQVLINLVDNAIKFTPAGGDVTITLQQNLYEAIITVRDNGCGIMSEDIPRIFERFYRADHGRSRASGGTGLGLSIVKHIVDSHGGKVWVDSEYSKGSSFSFTIPLLQN